jgi:short-subunit dehydrogenase
LDKDETKLRGIGRDTLSSDHEPLRLTCDLCECDQINAAVDQIVAEWGGVDILVNNAGVAYYGKIQAMSKDEWQRILNVNLLAPAELTRLTLPLLLAQPESHIVNVASMYGYLATNRCTTYHLTKFGLVGFSEALRAEYARSGLGVTVLCPGFVKTGLFNSMIPPSCQAKVPPSWICTTPEKVAHQAIHAIYRNRRLALTGWLAHLTYLIRRIAPGLVDAAYHVGRPEFLKTSRRAPRGQDATLESRERAYAGEVPSN